MEVCYHCGLPIKFADLHWAERFVARATMSSPAEYEGLPFHIICYDVVVEQDARAEDSHESFWVRRLSANPDTRDCS